ncbi:MAG: single-stranded DNA-binding protein [Ruminococcaceae bacterium]|nr:single-stranded DNA-binding protein [Oscillospiraceae bacterium]
MSDISRNEVELEGLVLDTPAFSHENHNTRFYRFFMEIPRLSGQQDTLPVLIPEHMTAQVIPGQALRLQGQLRSFNNRSQQGRRLVLSIHVQTLLPCQGEPCNRIRLSGRLCKPPILRRTPLGRSICDLMLAVPRRYGRTDYLPVIVWGRLAMDAAALPVSAPVELEGRIQSRLYTKVTEEGACERTAYEVSVMQFLEEAE